ncbi:formyltransferase family protein [Chitiniphilus eburneus]|uniref:phosphoribosylglycinamide formyltransferase 1 n=1 Tax=Chitiniphilus eburneus TaxID=2571148 RepID=A0A4U0PB64_9NEIS|nr:formyltransferase family protein [Chitiniphilus eburneus]TJZ64739.1 N(5)-hydroxyornithine transformylase PvdF [Chitiniphilus eburneus]
MSKTKLVYIWSLRNAAADQAGRQVGYKGGQRYMQSPLEYLARLLNETWLGDVYTLAGVINDDDEHLPRDRHALRDYGFRPAATDWFYPAGLTVQGRPLDELLHTVPSAYRGLPLGAAERGPGKHDFEARLQHKLLALGAELVVLDGLLIILDELVRPGSRFHRKIVNIHPGITRPDSPYQRRGAYATLDALHGARGQKVTDWQTMATQPVPRIPMTGASFHYVDNGIDSGEVIVDVLDTYIDPADTILELRWNNFNRSLFPALAQGLAHMVGAGLAEPAAARPTVLA